MMSWWLSAVEKVGRLIGGASSFPAQCVLTQSWADRRLVAAGAGSQLSRQQRPRPQIILGWKTQFNPLYILDLSSSSGVKTSDVWWLLLMVLIPFVLTKSHYPIHILLAELCCWAGCTALGWARWPRHWPGHSSGDRGDRRQETGARSCSFSCVVATPAPGVATPPTREPDTHTNTRTLMRQDNCLPKHWWGRHRSPPTHFSVKTDFAKSNF